MAVKLVVKNGAHSRFFGDEVRCDFMMDLGIVCQQASTGGVRYAIMLATSIRRIAPDVEVTFHHGRKVVSPASRAELEAAGVRLERLDRLPRARTARFLRSKRYLKWPLADRGLNALRLAYRSRSNRRRHALLAKRLDRHDVVHFAWPYELDPPPLKRAAASFIPHDFIYGHEFGVATYGHPFWDSTKAVIGRWVECAAPIVSSDFIASEFARVFPGARHPAEVIYLSSLHPVRRETEVSGRAQATCERFGLSGQFILCPNNLMPHKNLALLIAAIWHMRQAGEDVRLVVVGPETQGIRAQINCPLYGDHVEPTADWHMRGLGLVSDAELLDLMRQSLLVVNPSLCEAGSGSGLDAWGCGCPVALSDIPAFRDQVRYLGTHAAFFDPRDPRDAARVILAMIRDPERRAADAIASLSAIQRYDWREVARRYLAVFEGLMEKSMHSR